MQQKEFQPTDRVTLTPAGLVQAIREAPTAAEAQRLLTAKPIVFSLPLWGGVKK
jgi:hypothetical protein